jgi:hypothetical protein
VALEANVAGLGLKWPRWTYERGRHSQPRRAAKAGTVAGVGCCFMAAAGPLRISFTSTISCRIPLRGPLNRLAGSGLARGGFIVGFDPHEVGRYGGTAYWGCLVLAGGLPPA